MRPSSIIGLVLAGFAVLIVLMVIGGSYYTVDQGDRAVVLRNGEYVYTAEPGLHFKMPFVDEAIDISVQTQSVRFNDMAVYSRDQQTAILSVSVNYTLNPSEVGTIYAQYGGNEGIVQRVIATRISDRAETVFGQFNAVTAIQERDRLVITYRQELQAAIAELAPNLITINSVQIENIDFSDAYEQSIEQRMQAEVEVQRVRQNLERERVTAEITVTQAQAEADSQLARARAEAEAIRLRGEAEADAIKLRGEALQNNPSLISLIQAEKWNGVLPSTMVPNSTVPFLSIDR